MNLRVKLKSGRSIHRACLSSALSCALLVSGVVPSEAGQAASPGKLAVEVLAGGGLSHDVHTRAEREVTVRVVDEGQRPVSGAVVVFQLPAGGPGATFFDGLRFVTKLTDREGLATARALRPNSVPGEFKILITASYRDFEPATLEISHTNLDSQAVRNAEAPAVREMDGARTPAAPLKKKRRGSGLLVAIVAIVGGAAAGATLGLATRSRSASDAAPNPAQPTTIVAGSPNFGPPR